MEELRISFIRSNYLINLLNILFLEKPDRPKVSLAPQKIVYLGIKYFNNKFVKFAQRLEKSLVNIMELLKSFHNIKQIESYFYTFQPKLRIIFKPSPLVYKLPYKDCDLSYIGEKGK